jgi:hypothetical protein
MRIDVTDASTAWAVVAAALGSSLVTVGGYTLRDWLHDGRRQRAGQTDELKSACMALMSSAYRLVHRTSVIRLAMHLRSGLSEGIDIATRQRKPIDPIEHGEYMLQDMNPMLEAQARVWLLGDEELIRGASDIILAGSKVIETATALPPDRRPPPLGTPWFEKAAASLRKLKPLTRDEQLEASYQDSVRALGRSCWLFGEVMRRRIGSEDVEALIRAFPGFHTSAQLPTTLEEGSADETAAPSGSTSHG